MGCVHGFVAGVAKPELSAQAFTFLSEPELHNVVVLSGFRLLLGNPIKTKRRAVIPPFVNPLRRRLCSTTKPSCQAGS